MLTPDVLLAVRDRCAVITIDRPSTRNAIDRPTIEALGSVLDQVEVGIDSGDIAVVAIRGGGSQVFISGGDLKELAQIRSESDARLMAESMRTVLDRLVSLRIPSVAVLNGDAYGGGAEVAVACDIRIAASDVRIGFTHVSLGIMPAWGGVERLTTLVGRGRASHLLLTGNVVTAAEAGAVGLVEHVVERESFEDDSHALLAQLAAVPSTPARAITALVKAVAQPVVPGLAELATTEFAKSWASENHWIAVEAAAARRASQRPSRPTT